MGLYLIALDGGPVTRVHALRRFGYAILGIAAFGSGILWALFDRDKQFLHDRLAGTRLVIGRSAGGLPPANSPVDRV